MPRLDHDSIGEFAIPDDVYWGAQTARAIENFPISGVPISRHPELLVALAMVKQAAARANVTLGKLEPRIGGAIERAAAEIIAGRWHEQFPIDVIQGGAGTSTNMNMNEVLANRALELLGQPRGAYDTVHPNDHVNLSQSTNDAYPTAVRLAVIAAKNSLAEALGRLANAFEIKAAAFAAVLKLGRTEMQDAVPMTLGQELGAFATTLREDVMRLNDASGLLREVNLGGTAIGTRINADDSYGRVAIAALSDISQVALVQSENLVEASWDMGAFVMFSGVLKRNATKLSKIANDLRLLSSGPRGGFGEITLPPRQPGSSIMPGKVNPVIPEMVNLVCFQVIGNDLAITMAAEGGQLQLNAFEPLIAHNTLDSIRLLRNAAETLRKFCIDGIQANPEACLRHLEASTATATALVPHIGYERAAALAQAVLRDGTTVRALAEKLLPGIDLNKVLNPETLAGIATKYQA
ncbi:aspartate ammonia-lyase [Acidocella sp.]|uniref:aspartate ammonia-lyase n=1 Tax=Acidocella sp. TaxID=50710 RepID=UPI00261E7D57|nr:aspartate ammonia-lyase [Acidocella sp.]